MIRVGQRLKEARLKKGLSLENAASDTRIRSSFLSAIERGEYQKLPSPSYAQGFVRNYAEYLDLPQREILALFRREFDEEQMIRVLPKGFVKDKPLQIKRFKIGQTLLLIFGLLLLLGGFLLYQYRYAFFNPPLSVISPTEGEKTTTDVTVTGQSDPNVILTVNTIPVPLDDRGKFTKKVSVFPGSSMIVVKAVNKFGKMSEVVRRITVKTGP
ncbi:MAG: helix-turn-helix domain-containing protein [Candidatus Levybacteria bacterium]|nr:helix-turn-helix domain-containing protein [Candidatus Levybacteria bacterium]